MAVTPKTITLKMNLAPLRWSLRKVEHTIRMMFNKPWNVESVHDRKKLRNLAKHQDVLVAISYCELELEWKPGWDMRRSARWSNGFARRSVIGTARDSVLYRARHNPPMTADYAHRHFHDKMDLLEALSDG